VWKEGNCESIPSNWLLGIYLQYSTYGSKKILAILKKNNKKRKENIETLNSIRGSDESGVWILNYNLGVIYELSEQQPMAKTIISSP